MKKPCILVVDDNESHRYIVTRELRRLAEASSFRVEESPGAREALTRLPSLRSAPLLILSDHKMPEMNGIEFLRAVRAAHGDVVKFALFSSLDHPEEFSEARRLGAFQVFEKALELDRIRADLAKVVRQWLASP